MTRDKEQALAGYCERLSTPQSALLHELERETHLKTLAPQMMSGHLQGRVLSLISKLVRPACALEIGTFTGYAALCLAEGLAPGGVLHTVEANAELAYIIRKYIAKAGLEEQVHLHIGRAQDIVPVLEGVFDLVFIDAGKHDYPLYYDLVVDRMAAGGILLADNVLWSGKVLRPEQDADTLALHRFNEKVQQDPRVENLILPIRDGVLVARKL